MSARGETDDLASLAKLDETTLLEELKSRYTRDQIYVSDTGKLNTQIHQLSAVIIHDIRLNRPTLVTFLLQWILSNSCQYMMQRYKLIFWCVIANSLIYLLKLIQQRRFYQNVSRSQSPPHIFAVASSAYQQMMATGDNQCCVIR